MMLENFISKLKNEPNNIMFNDTMAVIDAIYKFTPTKFINGSMVNDAGQNNGSCKVFSFAKLNNLSVSETLNCFGDYYRKDVLENPAATDHQNIRNFIQTGWEGINFDTEALERVVMGIKGN